MSMAHKMCTLNMSYMANSECGESDLVLIVTFLSRKVLSVPDVLQTLNEELFVSLCCREFPCSIKMPK